MSSLRLATIVLVVVNTVNTGLFALAERAPLGTFLRAERWRHEANVMWLEPPTEVSYETRIGWLMGTLIEDPPGTPFPSSFKIPDYESSWIGAVSAEIEWIGTLAPPERSAYFAALIRDVDRMEKWAFRGNVTPEVARSVLIDMFTNLALAGSSKFLNDAEALQWLLSPETVDLFGPFINAQTGAMTALPMAEELLPFRNFRHRALRWFAETRCGCLDLSELPPPGPQPDWLRGRYRTRLGQLLAQSGRVADEEALNARVDAELARLERARDSSQVQDQVYYAAYLVNLLADLEILPLELLQTIRDDSFAKSVTGSIMAYTFGVLAATVGVISTATGQFWLTLTMSGVWAGVSEFNFLSQEEVVLVTVAAMRASVLDRLLALPNCGAPSPVHHDVAGQFDIADSAMGDTPGTCSSPYQEEPLLIGLPAFPETVPEQLPEEGVLVLVDTIFGPEGQETSSERGNEGEWNTEVATLGAGHASYSLVTTRGPGGELLSEWDLSYAFDPPPARIRPGETVSLTLSGTANTFGAHFVGRTMELRTQGGLMLENPNSPLAVCFIFLGRGGGGEVWEADYSCDFSLPGEAPEEARIQLLFGTLNITWVYRKQ